MANKAWFPADSPFNRRQRWLKNMGNLISSNPTVASMSFPLDIPKLNVLNRSIESPKNPSTSQFPRHLHRISLEFPHLQRISSKGVFHAGFCHELLPPGVDSHHGRRVASGGRDLFTVRHTALPCGKICGTSMENVGKTWEHMWKK